MVKTAFLQDTYKLIRRILLQCCRYFARDFEVQLTLLQPGGQIMPTTLLLTHPDLKSYLHLCITQNGFVKQILKRPAVFLFLTYRKSETSFMIHGYISWSGKISFLKFQNL